MATTSNGCIVLKSIYTFDIMLLLFGSRVMQNNENRHARYSWKWFCWENELINIFYHINKNNYLKNGTNVILDTKIKI